MSLRKHQAAFDRAIDGIIAGSGTRQILVDVTPGGGKSLIPILAGKLIKAGLAERLAWICPRLTLTDQAERNFLDPFFRRMLDHNLTIRAATNQVNPCRGQDGFVTTYQAVGVDTSRSLAHEFSRHKYVLILDEFHHAEEGGVWHKALAPLVERAAFVVLMTGTLARGDGDRIAFMPYRAVGHGQFLPDPTGDSSMEVVTYSRVDALKEHAILPLEFSLSDGEVTWETDTGEKKTATLSRAYAEQSAALYTALNTEFAEDMLHNALEHWELYRSTINPRSKFLVVAADIGSAKRFLSTLKTWGHRAEIATSGDTEQALRNIKHFRSGDLGTLCTVAMAYEGFDCQPLTHVCALTHIRSVPWIEQMIARAARVDRLAGPYSEQRGYIFAPDDPLMRSVVNKIEAEQAAVAKHSESLGVGGGGGGGKAPDVIPLGSELTGTRQWALGGIPDGEPAPLTVSEREGILRRAIEQHIRKFTYDNFYRPERINGELKAAMGKPRAEMTLEELEALDRYVRKTYPLNGNGGSGKSPARRIKRTLPTKAVTWPLGA